MRILIIDLEYLVAMEVERILASAFECDIQIAMPREYDAIADLHRFDVVVIDASLVKRPEAAERMKAAGVAIVFLTLIDEHLPSVPGWPDVPVVGKPFDDKQLIDAIRKAVGSRQPSVPGH